jgi:hypothetical protein
MVAWACAAMIAAALAPAGAATLLCGATTFEAAL